MSTNKPDNVPTREEEAKMLTDELRWRLLKLDEAEDNLKYRIRRVREISQAIIDHLEGQHDEYPESDSDTGTGNTI